jgi:hypothetical protein
MTPRYIEHDKQLPQLKDAEAKIQKALYDGIKEVQEHIVHDVEAGSIYIGVEGQSNRWSKSISQLILRKLYFRSCLHGIIYSGPRPLPNRRV